MLEMLEVMNIEVIVVTVLAACVKEPKLSYYNEEFVLSYIYPYYSNRIYVP